jgi:hypothetical protein
MISKALLIAAALIAVPSLAGAVSPQAVGVGGSVCTEYLRGSKSELREDLYVQWAAGMITGMAAASPKGGIGVFTLEKLATDLHRYCIAHESDTIAVAAASVAKSFQIAKAYPLGAQ